MNKKSVIHEGTAVNKEILDTSKVSNQSKINKKIIIVVLLALLIIGAGSIAYNKFIASIITQSSTNFKSLEENEEIIKKVSRLMTLPQNENPTIAIVSDVEKLKDQDLFKNTEVGDRVLIYQGAKIAILYRPSLNKIVNVGPVGIIDNELPATNSAIQSEKEIRIAVFNGTGVSGLASRVSQRIEDDNKYFKVTSKANSNKQDYKKSIIINKSNLENSIIGRLGKLVNAAISELPEGETMPDNVDVLIILGEDSSN